jgi:hypothetical protein
MARRKPRQAPATPKRVPASAPTSTAITAAPKTATVSAPASPQLTNGTGKREYSAVEVIAIRASRWLGSLQIAVVALAIFAAVVLLGTLMEHWYSTKVAQELVYKSWWFIGLLFLLAVNIFFAAAKKWPWKKHQTGFVITHIGLLMLLAGGILNAWFGVDAQMWVMDDDEPASVDLARMRFGPIPQRADYCRYSETALISIQELVASEDDPHASMRGGKMRNSKSGMTKGKAVEADFEGGPLPWHPDDKASARTDTGLALLNWFSNPFGRSWSMRFDNTVRMEVLDYIPIARYVPYGVAGKSDKGKGIPALRVEFASDRFGTIDNWVAADAPEMLEDGLPAQIEFLGTCPAELLDLFLAPPAAADRGEKGAITIVAGGNKVRLLVDQELKKKSPVVPGLNVEITEFSAEGPGQRSRLRGPVVKLKFYSGGDPAEVVLFAGLPGIIVKNGDPVAQRTGDPILMWYDPPDVRQGRSQLRGLLQLMTTDGDRVVYRAFTQRDTGFLKESSGEVKPGGDYLPVFKGMFGRFRASEFLPNAAREPRYVSAAEVPGKESDTEKVRYQPALRGVLTDGKEKAEFWLSGSDPETVDLGGRRFIVSLKPKIMRLGFEVKLQRALTTVDPGTRSPATYSSDVQLYDAQRGINGEHRLITMNEPLEHRGYKFYQSQLELIGTREKDGRPVNLSVFTVGYDPGLPVKYLGSICLAAGIFIMFYMRAYFFKRPSRVTPPDEPKSTAAAATPVVSLETAPPT